MIEPITIDKTLHFYLPHQIVVQMASQELPQEKRGRRLWFEEHVGIDPHYGIYLNVLGVLPIGIRWRITYYPEPHNVLHETMLFSDTLEGPPQRGLGVYTIRGRNDEAHQDYQFTITVAEADD
jgi:hypothetical protein